MKKLSIITVAALVMIFLSCGRGKNGTGRAYMPDMAYSRAVETYSSTEELKASEINYNATPVKGSIKRGELLPFTLEKDKVGDTMNYNASRAVANPLPALDAVQMKEAERLYLVNCGICHGTKLDGNGPLYNDGNGPYAAAPKNLITLNMPVGQMFYSIAYGKGQMGGYASQMSTTQRWMVISYIKSKQAGGAATPKTDSTLAKK